MRRVGEEESSFQMLQKVLAAYRSHSWKLVIPALDEAQLLENDILLQREQNRRRGRPLMVGKVAV